VLGNTHLLDAAADAMDSLALLLVDLAKLKTVTTQISLQKLIKKKRRRSMELKIELTMNT
jgi:hypothetical protein